jgi:hypothetical protein
VKEKLLTLWNDKKYENAVKLMSLEIKHAGGLKRAVEEIEFFVNLQGNLDRFVPFLLYLSSSLFHLEWNRKNKTQTSASLSST